MPYVLNAIYGALILASAPYWLYKSATTGKYRQGLWRKLIGDPPIFNDHRPVVWLHAVSVGEVLLLERLLARLQSTRPGRHYVLSTTTNTGYRLAKERYPDVTVFYAPFDFTWAVRRVFDELQPNILVLAELELWPNLLLEAKHRGVPVAVVNARLGERSFGGYFKIRRLLRPALSAVQWWGAQNATYAERLAALTAGCETTIEITGSMKYDGALGDRNNPQSDRLRRLLGLQPDEKTFVAGSTHPPEEEIALDAFLSLARDWPSLRLVIVPRHAERFEATAAMLARRGVEFVRRSQIHEPRPRSAAVTLVDTIGELRAIWGLADFAYVGGSMAGCGRGGQSMIEPAGFGVPICFGPETWNFKETADRLIAENAATRTPTPESVKDAVERWLREPSAAISSGQNAQRFVAAQQGSVEATFAALERWAPTASPRRRSA